MLSFYPKWSSSFIKKLKCQMTKVVGLACRIGFIWEISRLLNEARTPKRASRSKLLEGGTPTRILTWTGKQRKLGMPLFVLFLLHQTVFVYGRSNDFLTIKRHSNQNRKVDGFTVTGLYERSTCQEKCSHFKTSVVPSSNDECVCVCSPQAATFGIKNSTWQCINNRELRMRVLAGKLISLLPNEFYLLDLK